MSRASFGENRGVVLPIRLTPSQVRPVAYRVLSKKHGLNLKSDGLTVLTEYLGQKFGVDWRGAKGEKFLDEIAKVWKAQDRGLFLEGAALTLVIKEIISDAKANRTGDSLLANSPIQTITDSVQVSASGSSKGLSWEDHFAVVNCESQPCYRYNFAKKHFDSISSKPDILSSAQSLSQLFSSRYYLTYDRLLRNETFQTPSFQANISGSMSTSRSYTVTFIKNLLGRNNQEFLLFGLIYKGPDGKYWLQDKSGKVRLDIYSHAVAAPGSYYTEGNLVLCDGLYMNEQFVVSTIGPPPAERREKAREIYGYLDFLGVYGRAPHSGLSNRIDRIDRNLEKQLILQERQYPNHRILILGCNIYLDTLRYMDALRKLFIHLQNESDNDQKSLPISIILPGSFISTPFQPNGSSVVYKESFDFFAQLLGEFPKIASFCKFVFVPGDNDPWAATFSSGATPVWPLKPIPGVFTSRVKRASPRAKWASNPCKMTYFSQEFVVVRDDYGSRFRRNSILFKEHDNDTSLDRRDGHNDQDKSQQPQVELDFTEDKEHRSEDDEEDDEIASRQRALDKMVKDNNKPVHALATPYIAPEVAESRKVVRTIIDQGHLSPFALTTRPVAWDYDYTVHLTPLPSMLILADPTTPQFKLTYEGCNVINPGPFLHKSKINWMEYVPSTGHSEPKFIYL